MTACLNVLQKEIGLSSALVDHGSDDDEVNSIGSDLGVIDDLDIGIFLDQNLVQSNCPDDPFGDDYVDADDQNADGRRLRLFSPTKESARRKTKSVSIAPPVLPRSYRRLSSQRCTERLTNIKQQSKPPRGVQKKRGRPTKQERDTKRQKLENEKKALYAEFPKFINVKSAEFETAFKEKLSLEIANFNRTTDMPPGDKPFMDKSIILNLRDDKISSKVLVRFDTKTSKYRFEIVGKLTEFMKHKGYIRVRDIDPQPRRKKPNPEKKQVLQPAPSIHDNIVTGAKTMIKAENIINGLGQNNILLSNGNTINLAGLDLSAFNGGGTNISVLNMTPIQLGGGDGKQQIIQIVQAQQPQFQVVRPVNLVPVQNVSAIQNVTTIKPEPTATMVSPNSPSPATAASASDTMTIDMKTEPVSDDNPMMPSPPAPLSPKLEEQVFKLDACELMPPPQMPKARKLSLKDRLINSPPRPLRVPKFQLVRKEAKPELEDDKVITIKEFTEEEKNAILKASEPLKIPRPKSLFVKDKREIDEAVEEKIKLEKEAKTRVKTNILRRSDSSSRKSSPLPPKTEKSVPIKPTIIDNNPTIIKALPDGCQLLPIFHVAQPFTAFSTSNIITVVQRPNKVAISQNPSTKLTTASSTSTTSTTISTNSKPPVVQIQPKWTNNPIELTSAKISLANPGANEHKITLKIGNNRRKTEPESQNRDDRFISFKKSAEDAKTAQKNAKATAKPPPTHLVRKPGNCNSVKTEPVTEASSATSTVRSRSGSFGKAVFLQSSSASQNLKDSPVVQRMVRKRTETFSEAHFKELMAGSDTNCVKSEQYNVIKDLIEETFNEETNDKDDENCFDFHIADDVFVDDMLPDAYIVLPPKDTPEYLEYLKELENGTFANLGQDLSEPTTPCSDIGDPIELEQGIKEERMESPVPMDVSSPCREDDPVSPSQMMLDPTEVVEQAIREKRRSQKEHVGALNTHDDTSPAGLIDNNTNITTALDDSIKAEPMEIVTPRGIDYDKIRELEAEEIDSEAEEDRQIEIESTVFQNSDTESDEMEDSIDGEIQRQLDNWDQDWEAKQDPSWPQIRKITDEMNEKWLNELTLMSQFFAEAEVMKEEVVYTPMSPEFSDASGSPKQFEGIQKSPDRTDQKFYSPSKLDTPPDTPMGSICGEERSHEDLENIARDEMLRKIAPFESCQKIRAVAVSKVATDRIRISKAKREMKRRFNSKEHCIKRGLLLQVQECSSSSGIYSMVKDFARCGSIRSVQEVEPRRHLVVLTREDDKNNFMKALNAVKRSFGWKIRPAETSIFPFLHPTS